MATTKARGKAASETPEQELERLRAENATLRQRNAPGITFKVAKSGGVSVYGLGRWPTTLYREQWERLIEKVPELQAFIDANADKLATKEG